jgi:hypothetical protein
MAPQRPSTPAPPHPHTPALPHPRTRTCMGSRCASVAALKGSGWMVTGVCEMVLKLLIVSCTSRLRGPLPAAWLPMFICVCQRCGGTGGGGSRQSRAVLPGSRGRVPQGQTTAAATGTAQCHMQSTRGTDRACGRNTHEERSSEQRCAARTHAHTYAPPTPRHPPPVWAARQSSRRPRSAPGRLLSPGL